MARAKSYYQTKRGVVRQRRPHEDTQARSKPPVASFSSFDELVAAIWTPPMMSLPSSLRCCHPHPASLGFAYNFYWKGLYYGI